MYFHVLVQIFINVWDTGTIWELLENGMQGQSGNCVPTIIK